MRALVTALLVVLLALAPFAAAHGEGDDEPSVRATIAVSVDPFVDPVPPGEGPVTTPVTVTVPCRVIGNETHEPSTITLAVANPPSWADVTVTPAEWTVAPAACDGDQYARTVNLSAAVDADAPALRPFFYEVTAAIASPHGNASRTIETHVEAGFRGALEVVPPEAPAGVQPDGKVRVPVEVRNLGNAGVRVTFEVVDAPEGWAVPTPPRVTVAAMDEAAGEGVVTAYVEALPPASPKDGESAATFTLRYTSEHSLNPDLEGASGTFTVAATTPGSQSTPGPGPVGVLLAVGLVAAAVLVAARRRGR